MTGINLSVVGKTIQDRREKLHLSQQKVARDLNISFHYLSKIEHGSANVSLSMLMRIWQYLQMDIVDGLKGSVFRSEIYGTGSSEELITLYSKSDSERQQLIRMILELIEQ